MREEQVLSERLTSDGLLTVHRVQGLGLYIMWGIDSAIMTDRVVRYGTRWTGAISYASVLDLKVRLG